MPMYLTKFSYTPETWARLIKKPEDRKKAVGQLMENVGGRLHGLWYAFGDHDGYCLWEAPDNAAMAAVGYAVTGSGALSSYETIVLISVEEAIKALTKAQQVSYRPPST